MPDANDCLFRLSLLYVVEFQFLKQKFLQFVIGNHRLLFLPRHSLCNAVLQLSTV
jgi:hypothetical protein